MKTSKIKGSEILTTLTNLRFSIAFIICAIIFFIFSEILILIQIDWDQNNILASIIKNLGSLFFVTGLLSVYWDLKGKRTFTSELLEKFDLSQEIEKSGVTNIYANFQQLETSWVEIFTNVREIDLFFTYAQTWRITHRNKFIAASEIDKITVRIVLPNIEDSSLMERLAVRCQESVGELITNIIKTKKDFVKLRNELKNQSSLRIWKTKILSNYSIHRYDNMGLIAFYNHRVGRLPVPTLVCKKDGEYFNYILKEFEWILNNDLNLTKEIDYEKWI